MKTKLKIKPIVIAITGIITLAVVGTVGALNGWFGGGGSIPEDTMTRGLVGYWGMDEGAGQTAYDASGNSNNGTLTNGPKWTSGKSGSALQFDGVDDYVDAGNDASLNITDTVTVEAWIYLTNNYQSFIVGRRDSYNHGFAIGTGSGNKMIVVVGNGTSYAHIEAIENEPMNVWTHIVATYEKQGANTYLKFYRNGTLVREGSVVGNINNGGYPLVIGRWGTTYPFNGTIDEVRIYNRALSAEEIRYHYNRGGPVAEWKFNEGSGTTTYDSTANNNDGTLNLGTSGNTTTSNAWVQGKYGSGLQFDGVDDYAEATVSQTKTSYSLWIKPTASVWEHIVKIDSAYYVNGVPGTPTSFPIYVSGNTVQIGKTGASAYFNGIIDEVRIYNYARTADEIRLDYNAGFAARFGPSTDCNTDPGSCMTKGLVGYWGMDEGTGQTAYDASGNSNNGTLGASASADSADPKWTTGQGRTSSGSALQFDGINDYVDAGNGASLDLRNAFTIEMWVYANSLHDGGLYDRTLLGSSNRQWLSHTRLVGTIAVRVVKGGIYYDATPDMAYSAKTWFHLAATYNGLTLKSFKNSAQVGSVNASSPPDGVATDTVLIGRLGMADYFFNGTIDEVRVYNRALSAEEIRYHYNRGAPVAHWKFDEGSGTTTYDAIGNADAIFPTATTNQPTWSSP